MRALWFFGVLLVTTATLDALNLHHLPGVFFLEDTGVLILLREVALLVLLVGLVDWLVLPDVKIRDLILGEGDAPYLYPSMTSAVRAAAIRGWFTFIAALVIALALMQYT